MSADRKAARERAEWVLSVITDPGRRNLAAAFLEAESDLAALRELHNIHNLGGMTDYNDGPMKRALAAEQRAADLQRRLTEVEAVLIECQRIPPMPFPDPGAHSWEAFGRATFTAWSRIRQKIYGALNTQPNAAERSYSPEELYDVLEHTLLPTDFKKRMALLDLIKALEQPDAKQTEGQPNAAAGQGGQPPEKPDSQESSTDGLAPSAAPLIEGGFKHVTPAQAWPTFFADAEALRIEGWKQATEWLEGFSQTHYLVARLRGEIAKRTK